MSVRLNDLPRDVEGKVIFCTIHVENSNKGHYGLVGNTDWILQSKFVQTVFQKQMNIDFFFEEHHQYIISLYEGNKFQLDHLNKPDLHTFLSSGEFSMHECVNIHSSPKLNVKLSGNYGNAIIQTKENKEEMSSHEASFQLSIKEKSLDDLDTNFNYFFTVGKSCEGE